MQIRFRIPHVLVLALIGASPLRAQGSDQLYQLFPSRVHTMVKSSYDPDDRLAAPWKGNDDGFTGRNLCEAYRFSDNGTPVSVLADIQGRAGVMGLFFRNFWSDSFGMPMLRGENNRTRIWVDGQVAYDRPLWDFFHSPNGPTRQISPFDGPFTRRRSGAHLTNTQVAWTDSFRIGLDDDPFQNAARFHRVAMTLASPEGELPMADRSAWERIANNPGGWPHLQPRQPTVTVLPLAANGGTGHLNIPGPATLLELTFEAANPTDWYGLWARFTWDNAAEPQVELPLRYLGAMVEPPYSFPVQSLLVDNDGSNRVTCWFPMPFLQNARIEVCNRSAQPVPVRVTYALGAAPTAQEDWGYFTSFFRREITGTGETFLGPHFKRCKGMLRFLLLEDFADTSGQIPDMNRTHLEGDLCVRINGNRGDDHTFAASETSIGRWGWYLTPADRAFVSDTSFQSSILARVLPSNFIEYRRIMGSTFVFDPIAFVDGIEVVLEHGAQNTSNADYSVVAFLYLQDGSARRPIAEIDIGNTSVGDPKGEPANQVQFTAWNTYTQSGNFLRDQFYGTQPVTDTVRHIRDYLRFHVQRPTDEDLPLAIGLRLDRLAGPTAGLCQADVYVDGVYAGLLHVFTHNAVFPWKEGGECEVELPIALTKGKAGMTITLRPRPGSDPLNVARVWVYEYLK